MDVSLLDAASAITLRRDNQRCLPSSIPCPAPSCWRSPSDAQLLFCQRPNRYHTFRRRYLATQAAFQPHRRRLGGSFCAFHICRQPFLAALNTSSGQIPFDAFVLTNAGEIAPSQLVMNRGRIRTVGISLLGGNSGIEGPYELGIDEIWAVNEEDVTVAPSQF